MSFSPAEHQQQDLNKAMLHAASMSDFAKVRICVLNGARINATGLHGATVLHHALKTEASLTDINFLIHHGAHVNAVDDHGRSILYYAACSNGATEYVPFLIKQGAVILKETANPLFHKTFLPDWHQLIPDLVAAGADVNQKQDGVTPLIRAVLQQDISYCQTLLSCHPALDAMTSKGETALSISLWSDKPDHALALLKAGALLKGDLPNGKSLLQQARAIGRADLVELLMVTRVYQGTARKVAKIPKIRF